MQGSAIGFYGSRGDEELDEQSGSGEGFLAEVCRENEEVAGRIEEEGVRLAVSRTGIVLESYGGMLERMIHAYRFYMGGYMGSPQRWISWIHLRDEVRAIRFLLENEELSGPFNLTTEQPVTIGKLCEELSRLLEKPTWLKLPTGLTKVLFGQMGRELLLVSQKVLPRRLVEAGFEFEYSDIEEALNDIFERV